MRELEAKIAKSEQSIQECQIFMINGETLRSQHVLDEFQEDAKRSHLYDGVPVVIEGGPGTGKTTTMIQRLKFLISAEALREYDAPLSEQEMNELANPNVRDKNWLFFSPTDKLLGFLRDNMRGEDLNANEVNTTTLHTFCTNMLMAYKLRVPEKDGPFKLDRKSEGRCIEDSAKAIAVFEKFLVRSIASILLKKAKLKTSDYPWHKTAIQIKAYCKNAEKVKDINGLMNLFNSLQDNCKVLVSEQESVLNELKKKLAVIVANAILGDEDTKKKITQLFQSWNDDSEEDIVEEEAENDDDMDESEDDEQESSSLDFDALLYKNLKPLLRNLALSKIDPKTKISKRQKELYELAKSHIDSQDLSELAHLEWFKKNYAFLCRGIESNIFNQIPKRYKLFRREMVKLGHTSFNQVVLQKQLKKNKGSQIHSDELKLIIGFINNMILSVHKKSKTRFESMKNNNYVKAFIENAKPVIGIDEATDYSLLDYYFITSFKHYKHHSITLCGDIMQGLNNDGIKNWMELDNILPKLTVYELHTSYRQLPTLVDMSKQLYVDDQGTEAPYCSNAQRREDEPAPLCFISDDLEEKTEWMAKRINEIYKAYDNKMPSVGILVGDNVDIEEMVEIMQDQDILNGIQIFDCSDNKTANSTKCVKIYRLTEVKGMEFEVVFFHDIDTAITTHSEKLMRRYLYVGISRAATHLAATFTEKDGNEDILKYFNPSKINWKL